MSKLDYNYLINQVQRNLPTLPTMVNELTTILENPDSSTMVVEDIVTADQSMTAKILRVANSSLFRGSGEEVRDINHAIGSVGFDKIKDVVLNNSVFKLFKNDKKDKFSLEGLWQHSLGVASISRVIAKFLGKSWHETAYTCGLIHDIGKVARYKLDELDDTEFFLKDSRLAVKKSISFFKAELVNQSARHDYLGYRLCKNWGLSAWVESVVMWHHEPNDQRRQGVPSSEANVLVDVVILANWLAHHFNFGFSGHESADFPGDSLLERLQISQPNLEVLMKQVAYTLEETKEICQILGNDVPLVAKSQINKEKKDPIFEQAELNESSGSTESELREDWLGILAPFADLEEIQSKPIPLPPETELVLLNKVRSVFSNENKRQNLFDESIGVAGLMDAVEDVEVPSLSPEKMDFLMNEVRKKFKGE